MIRALVFAIVGALLFDLVITLLLTFPQTP
jgi:hypothetical protein